MSLDICEKVDRRLLCCLGQLLKAGGSYQHKLGLLLRNIPVTGKSANAFLEEIKDERRAKEHYFKVCLILMGQAHVLGDQEEISPDLFIYLDALDQFFTPLGGILAYQESVLTLLEERSAPRNLEEMKPVKGYDLTRESEDTKKWVLEGLERLGSFCGLFPIGGAADRLNIGSVKTVYSASFSFFGKSLLARLVEDVGAQEYLHFKLFGAQVTLPLFFMVSEKQEHFQQIKALMEEENFFNRTPSSITIALQPLCPLFNEQGVWHSEKPMQITKKPGGHGMLWKVARESGWLQKMADQGKKKMIVRQINNLVAGTDFTLLAFQGLGMSKDSLFGMAGCAKKLGAKEGTCVLKKVEQGYCLTNIEYCDSRAGLLQEETEEMLANTNILFADTQAINAVAKIDPFPGKMLNFRLDQSFGGEPQKLARLETMMQNISEHFVFSKGDKNKVFVAKGARNKTISCTKKLSQQKALELETPEQCLNDMMEGSRELLEQFCSSTLPIKDPGVTNFLFSYHKALGPLYSIIGQKIGRLHLKKGAEVRLDIADIYLEKCFVQGSLLIQSAQVMGHLNSGVRTYSDKTGSCILEDVKIVNRGADFSQNLWSDSFVRDESVEIVLEGHSRFIARSVEFLGKVKIVVPDGVEMEALHGLDGKIIFKQSSINKSKEVPFYQYAVAQDNFIEVKRGFDLPKD